MRRIRKIDNYVCFEKDSILNSLKKINDNNLRLVFVVSEHGRLSGSLSDGDIRRALLSQPEIDLNNSVENIMNKQCKVGYLDDDMSKLEGLFRNGVSFLPILDLHGKIDHFLVHEDDKIIIDNVQISLNNRCFIIAEIGNNHQGNINLAKELVDHAVAAGADCAKFQMRNSKSLFVNQGHFDDSADLGAQYTMDLLNKFQLSNDQLFDVFDYCKQKNIIPLCTPWDEHSLNALEDYGMKAYKVASADFTNYSLLEKIAATNKPFLCSTGMTSEIEIIETVEFLNSLGADYALLHCNSTYPAPYKDINLKYMNRLKDISKRLVGYSGHERGIFVPVSAVALGAKIIEKHLTIDKDFEGTDHKVSLLPEELLLMVKQIRYLEEAIGFDDIPREISQGELLNRETLAKSLIANCNIKIGDTVTRDMVEIKSPGQGLQPNMIKELIGRKADRFIRKNTFFYKSDILGTIKKRNNYKFSRPFGVPVRYHDFNEILLDSNIDFVEFHLSYKDLELNIKDYIKKTYNIGFAVHAPELFSHDHILDLSSDDNNYRTKSIKELENVIKTTESIKEFFPKEKKPVIVVNVGGWNPDGFITTKQQNKKYLQVAAALNQLDIRNVTIAIQTMPPFPWHFGGQSHHNLFVNPDEISDFCKKNPNFKICLDTSHTMMACNFYGWNFSDAITKILPHTAHMHIVDAKGIDGEGIEIGEGDINFKNISNLLDTYGKDIQFIPEIWQGHKNYGEGFWKALDYLENYL
ncbi:N-acetylneuraminate synthase family protein [Amylibacter sp.]|nr:N-acetylneuraminate synthase family protein [Amylibacter sp.]